MKKEEKSPAAFAKQKRINDGQEKKKKKKNQFHVIHANSPSNPNVSVCINPREAQSLFISLPRESFFFLDSG